MIREGLGIQETNKEKLKIVRNTNPIFTEHFKGKKDKDFTLEDKRKIAAVLLLGNQRHQLVKKVMDS